MESERIIWLNKVGRLLSIYQRVISIISVLLRRM